MKALLLFLAFILICSHAFAQPKIKASYNALQLQLAKSKDDSDKVKLLVALATDPWSINHSESVLFSTQALKLSKKIGWLPGQASSLALMSQEQLGLMKYSEAMDLLFKALKINEELNDSVQIAKNYVGIAQIYFNNLMKVEQGIEYYQKAKLIFEARNDTLACVGTYSMLGNAFANQSSMRDTAKALFYFKRAINIFKSQNNNEGVGLNYLNMGMNIFLFQKDYNAAMRYVTMALESYTVANSKYGIGICMGYIGKIFYDYAREDNLKKIATAPFAKDQMANARKAIPYLKKGIELCKEIKSVQNLVVFSRVLSNAYELTGDYKKALLHYQEYFAYNDSVSRNENQDQIMKLETQRQVELREKQIRIDELEVAKKRKERVYYITGILLLTVGIVVLVFVILIIRKANKRQVTLNNQLQESNKTISHLVTDQEAIIADRTEKLLKSNQKLVELIQYSAHNMREPLARVMGAMSIRDMIPAEEFDLEIWPQMAKAVTDLDNSIKEVVNIADETIGG
jgi:tetratricopeptide (TPR) repeat protein